MKEWERIFDFKDLSSGDLAEVIEILFMHLSLELHRRSTPDGTEFEVRSYGED